MCKTIHESFYNLPGDDMGFPLGTTRWEPSSAVTMAVLLRVPKRTEPIIEGGCIAPDNRRLEPTTT